MKVLVANELVVLTESTQHAVMRKIRRGTSRWQMQLIAEGRTTLTAANSASTASKVITLCVMGAGVHYMQSTASS
jgi:hypothetical protein